MKKTKSFLSGLLIGLLALIAFGIMILIVNGCSDQYSTLERTNRFHQVSHDIFKRCMSGTIDLWVFTDGTNSFLVATSEHGNICVTPIH